MMQQDLDQMVNLEQLEAFETWVQQTKTKLVQIKGQRKYGGPPEVWAGPIPGAHCEVFISQIPRDTFEDQLIPLFRSVGPLWEFRLMMNFSGHNRGYAYAKYGTAEVAVEAIRLLHGHRLKFGHQLCVCHSTEKRKLSIEGLPPTIRIKDLLKELSLVSDGVESVALKTMPNIEGKTGIVCFTSHYFASMAKRVIVAAFQRRFALTVSIKWLLAERLYPGAQKPPRLSFSNEPRQWQAPPPPPQPELMPSNSPMFCRAPGGPVAHVQPHSHSWSSSAPPQSQQASTKSPVNLLQKLCESTGMGEPNYEVCYSHTELDGFLCLSYRVWISGIVGPFTGKVAVLPGPTIGIILEEAQKLAALQILQSYPLNP